MKVLQRTALSAALALLVTATAHAQVRTMTRREARRADAPVDMGLPRLPDSTGWGVPVLALARDNWGGIWAGTYGRGIFVLPPHGAKWGQIRHDTTGSSISFDFVNAIAFGARGEIWYGTVGNGWGLSLDGGHTWRNWTLRELGPEWQYVAPDGIVVRGDTVYIATADGVQVTTDDGGHWQAIEDGTGPLAKGPADTAFAILPNEYVRRISLDRRGVVLSTLRGVLRLEHGDSGWTATPAGFIPFRPVNSLLVNGRLVRGTPCGLRFTADTMPCYDRPAALADTGLALRTTWFGRPISVVDNPYIDQTYRYGSTMGGTFQPHQGVEFNNPDGTPVHAIGSGVVVYSGRAEAGANTVAILMDSTVTGSVPTSPEDGPPGPAKKLRIYSVYYHNTRLGVQVGDRVKQGDVIAWVGNTGRATNDHIHLEVHASPTDSVQAIVDSLNRYPSYTTNPELWIQPLDKTGAIAGQVWDTAGNAVPQARIYGLIKPDPIETPFEYIETYGPKNHSHPLYHEHFAISDVPPGTYILGTEIDGKKVFRKVTVVEGKLAWVVFKP
ncbi:MAG TPA: M23 family metallopeptidase [Gemmatimonadales bacterium]|nr:M23 family metallopeptidase [Gemmatimonadales bacterium]